MKIAVLTSGILPVPAVRGGAVENLVDFYLDYNDRHRLHDITVYSIADPAARHHRALRSEVNHYRFIDVGSPIAKLCKRLMHWRFQHEEYYHYTIEYYLRQAISDIRRRQFDTIVIENRPGYALRLREVTDARLVYHLHNEKLDISSDSGRTIYDAATRILTVSDYIRSRVMTINPADTKTVTIHNGIDLSRFAPATHSDGTSPTARQGREALGLSSDDFVLVFSGRVNSEKGIMELVEAMSRLQHISGLRLLVIGSSFYDTTAGDDEFTARLKAKAAPLADRILFTGFVPYSRMPDYLAMADVAVVPSVWDDPFPTTVLEAQAMGLPVIATRRGGIPEEVTDDGALLIDTGEGFVQRLADAISQLYSDAGRREAMGRASRANAARFDKDRYARDFFNALQ